MTGSPQISVVVPVFNEAGNILPLLNTIVETLTPLGREFEIILANDGSTDATGSEIIVAQSYWSQCTELQLPHRGQAFALLAGLREARGDVIVTLDGDGQNDPRDIPALLALVESGDCDIACGWRVERHDSALRRVMSRLANAVRGGVLDDQVHDAGCQLRVFRREIVATLYPFELMQSFIPALAVAAGFRVRELPVHHHARRRGDSKYNLRRLWWRPALAMLALRWRLWCRIHP
jgi:dolichol-phosphate mannosyltransferase